LVATARLNLSVFSFSGVEFHARYKVRAGARSGFSNLTWMRLGWMKPIAVAPGYPHSSSNIGTFLLMPSTLGTALCIFLLAYLVLAVFRDSRQLSQSYSSFILLFLAWALGAMFPELWD